MIESRKRVMKVQYCMIRHKKRYSFISRKNAIEAKEKIWREKNLDGIVDCTLYSMANPKILFIGQEPWTDSISSYKGQIEIIKTNGRNPKGNTTLSWACEIARCLLKKETKENSLEYVAWMNVKKEPRIKSSENYQEVCYACQINTEYLFEQIGAIKPEIIIGFNVLDGPKMLYKPWLGKRGNSLLHISFTDKKMDSLISRSPIDFYVEQNTRIVIVDVPHPHSRETNNRFKGYFPSLIAEAFSQIKLDNYMANTTWVPRRQRIRTIQGDWND